MGRRGGGIVGVRVVIDMFCPLTISLRYEIPFFKCQLAYYMPSGIYDGSLAI